ncbi:MAG: tyrosine-protein phosphatase, partial [Firmicutes bacterium]|nr:tyrosine-protein phosphatase [Bacillota bacterium]
LIDVPYYNGYYTDNGEPLLIAYPGYDYIKACINNGDDLWVVAEIEEGDTAGIVLREKGKYLDIQKARDIHYTDAREDYASDEIFANFRALTGGSMGEGTVYRSASPCDDQHNRASYVDKLMTEKGVKYIVDLADTDEKIKGYLASEGFDSPGFKALYEDGKVLPVGLNMNFKSDEFRSKLAAALTAMSENEGPFLIHCTEGKDRTGFVCMVLEALEGASYEELVNDYMITYANYYGITEETDKARCDVIVEKVLEPMMRELAGDEDLKLVDFSALAAKYLMSCGMTEEQVLALVEKL